MRSGLLPDHVIRSLNSRRNRIYHNLPQTGEALRRLALIFGPAIGALPRRLRIELMAPELQVDRPVFSNMHFMGQNLLQLYLNAGLGTQTVLLGEGLLAKYAKLNKLGSLILTQPHICLSPTEIDRASVDLLVGCVASMRIFVGPNQCHTLVNSRILNGQRGLKNVYLDALAMSDPVLHSDVAASPNS